jgi:hypothetical protein
MLAATDETEYPGLVPGIVMLAATDETKYPGLVPGIVMLAATDETEYPGLVPGIVMLAATDETNDGRNATGLPGGSLRCQLGTTAFRATHVTIHGASPWHSGFLYAFCR